MWHKFIACFFLVLILKGVIEMKIFLTQIYCLFFFSFDIKRYYRNENYSGTNLLLAPF